jgi:hypothetical protein
MVTVNLITRHNVKVDANYAPVVRAKEILVREWEVKVQYTFREANVAAVWLDKKSFLQMGLYSIDLIRSILPRLI